MGEGEWQRQPWEREREWQWKRLERRGSGCLMREGVSGGLERESGVRIPMFASQK